MPSTTIVIVTAHNEADRLPSTLGSLATAFPDARVVVADDGSSDGSGTVAERHGAELVRSERTIGKGGIATRAAALIAADARADGTVVVLCDGDLGETAGRLRPLADAVRDGACDLAIANFVRRAGGGFGIALGTARWVTEHVTGRRLEAPISGQRAVRGDRLSELLPFAPRFGMETGMNIDAVRAGLRVHELEVDLAHRATGRTWGGFLHRGRQLLDFLRVYADRR